MPQGAPTRILHSCRVRRCMKVCRSAAQGFGWLVHRCGPTSMGINAKNSSNLGKSHADWDPQDVSLDAHRPPTPLLMSVSGSFFLRKILRIFTTVEAVRSPTVRPQEKERRPRPITWHAKSCRSHGTENGTTRVLFKRTNRTTLNTTLREKHPRKSSTLSEDDAVSES